MGRGLRVEQFTSGFPLVGGISEPRAYPEKRDPPPPISAPELLSGAPKRCKARIYDSRPHREYKLWDEALLQV